MKHLNLILTLLILICYPLHPAYAFFDKDIQLLTMRDGLADNTIPCIYTVSYTHLTLPTIA